MSTVSFAQQTVDLPNGCEISIPAGFAPTSTNTLGVKTFVDYKSALVLNINSAYLDGEIFSLESFERSLMSSMNADSKDFQVNSDEQKRINSRDVSVIHGSAVMFDRKISITMYIYVVDGYAYVMTCSCLEYDADKYASFFDSISELFVKK